MHIAYYSPAWPPVSAANGIVTYVSQMKNALEKMGHRVTVFTSTALYSSTGEIVDLNIPRPNIFQRLINRLSPRPNWQIIAGRRLAAAVSQYCADVDLLEMEESFGLVDALQKTLPIPVVVRLHGPNFRCQIEQLRGKALIESEVRTKNEGVAIKSAKYITSPSAQVLKDALDFYRASPHLAHAIHNPAPETIGKLWSFDKSNRFEILHVGRFDRLKGADLMVQAFCLVARKYGDARLIMVGPDRGLQVETGELLNFVDYCQRYVPEELRARVIFLGQQEQIEVNACRVRSHIAVIPSRFEVLPYSALETLSVGTPLICADGIADNALVIDTETGWHFKNGSAESLANSIFKAFECGDDIRRIANAGRDHCKTHFHPDVIAPKMIAYYENVLKDYYSG